jgi:putative oxidoreductase
MISRPFSFVARDGPAPASSGLMGARKHCRWHYYSYAALRNAADFLGDVLSLRAATRYELTFDFRTRTRLPSGETIMNETMAAWAPRVLSVLRIYTGLLLLEHGTAKILSFPAVPSLANIQINSFFGAAGVIELIGGALLTVGLFTRPVAFILSGFAAVGYFMVHAVKGFYPVLNGGEFVGLLCFVALYLACAGAGPWSVDAMMKRE